ncbi:DUF4136 domain-containing protein [Arenibacter certesii]|nr:DUF4136 domain-containing protein [Arenibacter certesii]
MKNIRFLIVPIFALLLLVSCTSVQVLTDYDREANFDTFKTYAFYKTGIDKAQISDLDKKRILKAIDSEMSSRGFVKSNEPDILLSIFTKERQQVDVYSNYWGSGYYGWGWNPYFWGGPYSNSNVSTRTEGSLYIDIIDAKNKELVWQGRGVGSLHNIKNIEKKEARIKEFVAEILQAYPPGSDRK